MLRLALLIVLAAGLAFSSVAFAGDVYVNGYFKSNGTYVQPYYRTAPDSNPYNNFSTKGNVNPYTGEAGTRNVYPSYSSPNYGSSNSYNIWNPSSPLTGSGSNCVYCN
jgi:hypothetical protein